MACRVADIVPGVLLYQPPGSDRNIYVQLPSVAKDTQPFGRVSGAQPMLVIAVPKPEEHGYWAYVICAKLIGWVPTGPDLDIAARVDE